MKQHIEKARDFMLSLGLKPEQDRLELLDAYCALVLEKAGDFNLTAAQEAREIWLRHIADGAAAVPLSRALLENSPRPLVADAGAGAGFSGITLKILWPDAEVLLIDSLGKRCAFMDWACTKLGLAGIKTTRIRLGQEKADIVAGAVIERAMGKLEDIAGPCADVAAPGGYFIAYRSSPPERDGKAPSPLLEAAQAPERLMSYTLPGESQKRYFAVFKRKAST